MFTRNLSWYKKRAMSSFIGSSLLKLNTLLRNSFFFLLNFDSTFFTFYSLCTSLNIKHCTLNDVFFFLEMSTFSFLSNNFFSSFYSHSTDIFINNVQFFFSQNALNTSISIGDIVEFREKSFKSCYVDSYILFFNIILFCKLTFLKKLFYKQLIFSLLPYFFQCRIKKSVKKLFLFYPRWFFRSYNDRYLFRPLHYYFHGSLYKTYKP